MNKFLSILLTTFTFLKGLYLRIKYSVNKSPYSAIAHNCCVVYIPSLKEYLSVHNTPFVDDMINLAYNKELEPEQNVTGLIINNKFFVTSISVTKTPFHTIRNVPQIKNSLRVEKSLCLAVVSVNDIVSTFLMFFIIGIIIIIYLKNRDDNNNNQNNNTYLNH